LQTALPFDNDFQSPSNSTHAEAEFEAPPPLKRTRESRKHRQERFEISIPKLENPPVGGQAPWSPSSTAGGVLLQALPFSVAPLRERRRAASIDVGLLLVSYGGMLALFTVLGGHIGLNKLDLAVAGATFALFYAQYFALFTVFGGSTPGMMLRGLRVVSFDGGIPTSRQMAWRSLGYLISAGSCLLGFLWALWDEDQLCWQDRISQTYLTPNEEITPG
jgi:RDD family protein